MPNDEVKLRLAKLLAGMLDLNDDDMAQPITSDILVNPYEAADYILSTLSAIPSTVSGETEALAMARAVIADMVESGFIHSNERTGSGYYVGENVVPIIMGRASPANPAETQAVEVEE